MGLPEGCEIALHRQYKKGEKNLITDVPGVRVGHVTLNDDEKGIHTGVTAVLPHGGNLFREKVVAGAQVINGFGKSAGLVQVEELGTIEAPIMLTNTFGVGAALNGCIRYMMEQNPEIGGAAGTVNCVVTECNDGFLNDIRGLHVTEEHAIRAIQTADKDFVEGAAGAGTGMKCLGFKGGIGSSSRILDIDGTEYHLGALVMSNFGRSGNLRIDGKRTELGRKGTDTADKGSIIIIIGTDIPLSDRQLKRTARRAAVGLARTGSYLGNGSGDVAIAFSTANIVPHQSEGKILEVRMLMDSAMDPVFEATAEAVEEAVLSSLYHAETMKGFHGHMARGLKDALREGNA